MSADKTTRRLGRGLEALLTARDAASAPTTNRGPLQTIPIAQIRANPYQPRTTFRPEELESLRASIQASGLLQPITVRSRKDGTGYELIAGERRLRAAGQLGWTEIPAVVKEIDDRTLLTLALIENLQRSDLDPLEEALGYRRLMEEFSLTQQQVAEVVGKDRSTVANTLRLLNLPASVRRLLQEREISPGHARALLPLGDEGRMVQIAREAARSGLSVRDVEHRVRAAAVPSSPGTRRSPTERHPEKHPKPPEARRIEDDLRGRLQTDVSLTLTGPERGSLTIAFYSSDDLERIVQLVLGT